MTTDQITAAGAVVDVMVGVGPRRARLLRKNKMRVPDPVHVRSVIDTGAGISGFAGRVFRQLELPPVGTIHILTPSTPADQPKECPLYDVTLYLVAGGAPRPVLESQVIAAEGWQPGKDEGIEGLLGRDILAFSTLQYMGLDRTFTLAFRDCDPSLFG